MNLLQCNALSFLLISLLSVIYLLHRKLAIPGIDDEYSDVIEVFLLLLAVKHLRCPSSESGVMFVK